MCVCVIRLKITDQFGSEFTVNYDYPWMNRPTCRCREMSKIHSFSMDNRIYTIWEAEWYLINLLVKREIIELVRPNYWSCHVFYTSIFDPADMKLNPTASLLCFGSTNNNFQSIIWSYHWPIYVSIYTIGPLNGDNKYIYIAKKKGRHKYLDK
jgi:hypothetical protein